VCEAQVSRLGLLTSSCVGASQESQSCNSEECEPRTPTEGCQDLQVPSGFFGFNGKPVVNIADCTWDYFSCTNTYGAWPGNKACCDGRFSQCCMLVMTPTTHSPVSSGGYGPAEPQIDIEIENDLDLPSLESPIDDIDLAGGQSIHRPGVSAVTSEQDLAQLCSQAATDLVPHPSDCARYLSCQPGTQGGWIVTVRDCSPGTVFDTQINSCNYREAVPRCSTGRRARVIDGFEDNGVDNFVNIENSDQFQKVFENVNQAFAKLK